MESKKALDEACRKLANALYNSKPEVNRLIWSNLTVKKAVYSKSTTRLVVKG